MIAFLQGKIKSKWVDSIALNVNGVGYEVFCPLSTFYQLPNSDGRVELYIHTYVKEDALKLYGFLTLKEKALFTLLLSINGIGPKVALQILSHLSVDAFIQAVNQKLTEQLRKVPGIGLKVAERIILEVQDKIAKTSALASSEPQDVNFPDNNQAPFFNDLVSALTNLGYNEKESRKRSQASLIGSKFTSFEQALKHALNLRSP